MRALHLCTQKPHQTQCRDKAEKCRKAKVKVLGSLQAGKKTGGRRTGCHGIPAPVKRMVQEQRPKAFSAQEASGAETILAASGHPALSGFLFFSPCFPPEPGIRALPPTSPIPCLCITQPTHNQDDRGGTEEQTLMQDLQAWHQGCTILRAFLTHTRGDRGREEAWPCSPHSPFCRGSFMQTALCKQGTREAELLFTNCRERGKMKA